MSSSIPQTSGVYQIRCIPTGKVYVGSSSNLRKRWMGHLYRLSRDIHGNPHLQAAWNYYRTADFVFEVLELCPIEDLYEREQWYIDTTRCYEDDRGFNVGLAAHSPNLGRKMPPRSQAWKDSVSRRFKGRPKSPESVAKMRATKTGKPNPHAAKVTSRTYRVFYPDGATGIIFNLAAFCREHGLSHSGMLNVACGLNRQYKGWRCERL